jgi:hypothetical protein
MKLQCAASDGPPARVCQEEDPWHRDAAARSTAGLDLSEADQVPTAQFNRVLWTGLMGGKPYPVRRGASLISKID